MIPPFAREMTPCDGPQLATDYRQQPIQRFGISGTPVDQERRDVRIGRCHERPHPASGINQPAAAGRFELNHGSQMTLTRRRQRGFEVNPAA